MQAPPDVGGTAWGPKDIIPPDTVVPEHVADYPHKAYIRGHCWKVVHALDLIPALYEKAQVPE